MNHFKRVTWLQLVTAVLLFVVMMITFIIIFSEITTYSAIFSIIGIFSFNTVLLPCLRNHEIDDRSRMATIILLLIVLIIAAIPIFSRATLHNLILSFASAAGVMVSVGLFVCKRKNGH